MSESPVTQGVSTETTPERWFRRLLGFAAALVMFTMMMVTFIDVVGRDFFDYPLPGGFEVTELLLAALIFLGLPLVTAEAGHVDVDLLDNVIPRWLKPVQALVINLINIAAFSTLTWLMWKFSIRTYQYQDTTAILQIPYAGLTFLMAITCTLATLALLVMLFTGRKRLLKADDEYQT
ncbi:MAG: TRAP transporter small permease [Thiolinea sp.]